MEPEATPDDTVVPFTVIVAFASVRVGVTDIEVVAFDTEVVYVVVEEPKLGERVPEEVVNADSVASPDSRVNVIVYVLVVVS
jgi:hypothetical protein